MKKALSITLTAILFISLIFPVSAFDPLPPNEQVEYLFKSYYGEEADGAKPEDVVCTELENCPGSEFGKEYYLIRFSSTNALNEPYYNPFGDNDEFYEKSEKTNLVFSSGIAVFVGNPYNDKNNKNFLSLTEIYHRNPEAIDFIAEQVGTEYVGRTSVTDTQKFVDTLNAYVKATGLAKLYSALSGQTEDYTFTTETVRTDRVLNIIKTDSETAVFAFDTLEPYEASEIIDGYRFVNPAFLTPTEMNDKLGICVYKDSKIYTLREAVEKNIYTAEELAKILPNTVKVEEPASTQPVTEQPTTEPLTTAAPNRDVKKANPMKAAAKTKTVKAKKLKKGKLSVKVITVKNAEGKVSFKKLSGSKKLTVTKKGKITIKKGTKKGAYRIKVKITATGNSEYSAKSVIKTVKVKVK